MRRKPGRPRRSRWQDWIVLALAGMGTGVAAPTVIRPVTSRLIGSADGSSLGLWVFAVSMTYLLIVYRFGGR